jgi:hypothetical protein
MEGFGATAFVAASGYGSDGTSRVFDGHFARPAGHEALERFPPRSAGEGGGS